MTIWRVAEQTAIAVAFVLGGAAAVVGVAYAGSWLLARLARRFGTDDTKMSGFTYRKGFEKADESLHESAEERRRLVFDATKKASRIASGHVEERPRLITRGNR